MLPRPSWSNAAAPIAVLLASGALAAACALHTNGLLGAGGEGGSPTSSASTGGATSSASSSSTSASSTTSASSSSSASSTSGSSTSSSSSSSSSTSGPPPPLCGNGNQETGEECDDGNTTPGDGCGATCLVEHPADCPGAPISINTGDMLVIQGDTTGASDEFQSAMGGTPGNCPGGPGLGPDVVYAVTPSANGKLTVSLDATFSHAWVNVRTQCPGTTQDQVACYFGIGAGPFSVQFDVTSGVTYYVAPDSWQNNWGQFTLKLSMQ